MFLEKKNTFQDLKLIVVTPWETYTEKRWSDGWNSQYQELVRNADLLVPISNKYTKEVFDRTQEWIVDHCSRLIVYFNKMPGGAWNMVKYAEKQGLDICTNYTGYEMRTSKDVDPSQPTMIPYPQNLIRDIGYKLAFEKSEYAHLTEDQLAGLEHALLILPERLREIAIYRYKERQTLQQIGDRLELSRERVRQLQVKAIGRLRRSPYISYIRDGIEKTELEMKKQTAERMRDLLLGQQKKRPWMEDIDIVKFVFQAMLGVGHAVRSENEVLERMHREMSGLGEPEPGETLTEQLSPEWFRVNLRVAKIKGISDEQIARLVYESSKKVSLSFTRQNVYNYCVKLVRSETMAEVAKQVLDDSWLPSHSEKYRELYHPAYCVIHKDLKGELKARSAEIEEE